MNTKTPAGQSDLFESAGVEFGAAAPAAIELQPGDVVRHIRRNAKVNPVTEQLTVVRVYRFNGNPVGALMVDGLTEDGREVPRVAARYELVERPSPAVEAPAVEAPAAAPIETLAGIQVGSRVRGRDVTLGDQVEGEVQAILYPTGGAYFVRGRANGAPAYFRRYEIVTDAGRETIVENAVELAEPAVAHNPNW